MKNKKLFTDKEEVMYKYDIFCWDICCVTVLGHWSEGVTKPAISMPARSRLVIPCPESGDTYLPYFLLMPLPTPPGVDSLGTQLLTSKRMATRYMHGNRSKILVSMYDSALQREPFRMVIPAASFRKYLSF